MSHFNVVKNTDFNKVEYRNGGGVLKLHTNSYEFIAYGKIPDIKRGLLSKKRMIDRSSNHSRKSLNTLLESVSNIGDIIRFELRLNTPRVIHTKLKGIVVNSDLTLENLFSLEYSKKLILKEIQKIEKNIITFCSINDTNINNDFAQIRLTFPNSNTKEHLCFIGLMSLAKNNTINEIRSMFNDKSNRTWYRYKSTLKKLNVDSKPNILFLHIYKEFDLNKYIKPS